MRRLFFMLIILFLLYLGIQFAFYWFSGGQDNIYEITDGSTVFEVNETSNFNYNNYAYNITVDETTFSFQVFQNYNKASKVLESIKYYDQDNYQCILPIFKDNLILIDMICKVGDTYNYYFNLQGDNANLDKFANDNYNPNQFVDNTETEVREGLDIYIENLVEDHYISFNNYKGVYIVSDDFNSKAYNISLFSQDIYNQELGQFVDRYYIVPDYNQNHQFHEMNIVDLVSLDTIVISSNQAISFDSYIQGVVDNKIYLYDKDNAVQYEIDPHNESVVQLSNQEIRYYDGEWSTMTIAEANSEKKFITNIVDYTDEQYAKIDKVGNEVGYYYLYRKNGNKYDVYRINIQDKSGLIYLFSTQSIDSISYVDDYVYFINDNKIKVYNDKFGIRNLIEYEELEFNEDINFYVYAN